MRRLTSTMAIGAVALVVGVASAASASAAKGGNNDTAKACQQGAWQGLLSESGDAFKNQGDCVNDGAQAVQTWGASGQAACVAIPGYLRNFFRLRSATSWTCEYTPGDTPPNDQYTASLRTACLTDSGGGGNLDTALVQNGLGYWQAICYA